MGISRRERVIRDKIKKILKVIISKKAKDPIVLDIRNISNLCDYFIVCSGTSGRQLRTIFEEVIKKSKEENIEIHHIEDDDSEQWFLIDFFDFVLHIFSEEARQYYEIERLWKEGKKIRFRKIFSE